ncbi:amidohydrolase family protein [Nonomuraea sp. NPDC005650]|uniref:amidohydrolase family protein n=1 Tax=Nonomuraea sp. NPDC005650 TaxID=3157045 RepID=UPI0033B2CC9B
MSWDIAATGQPAREVSFTTSEGTWMSVSVAPDGSAVVFDLLGDLYSVPAEGGTATLLQGGPAMHRMPSVSPDGAEILYLSDADGFDNLWACGIDGSNPRQLTWETDMLLTDPVWGPDGRSVIAPAMFRAHRRLFSSQIRLFEGPGQGRLLVDVPASGRDVLEPALSPDGAWLYYTERLVNPKIYVDANHANYAIKRRRLEDGHTDTVVGGFGGAIRAALSPDGRRLAFIRRVMAKTVLFCLDLTPDGRQRPVFDGLDRDNQAVWELQGNYYPRFSWFPDSRHVAIWAGGGLQRIDMDGGGRTPIPFTAECRHTLIEPVRVRHDLAPEKVTARAVRHLAVAPGGQDVAFTALGRLWHTTRGKDAISPVGDHTRHANEPAYSRDGRRLAYVEWDDERGSTLRVCRRDRWDEPAEVTASSGVLRQPAFSPDGTLVAYRLQEHDVQLGGSTARPGLYVVSSRGGEPRYLGPADDAPVFAPDGTRIYASAVDSSGEEPVEVLFSVDLRGGDRREHARAAGPDTYELRLSPDREWLAFRHAGEYHVIPYRETGHELLITADTREVPCHRLTGNGGYALAWAADGRSVHWALGPELHLRETRDWSQVREPAPVRLTADADVPDGCVALTGGTVITMRGEEVLHEATVVVRGNRVVAVGDVPVPEDATVVDCTGMTLMPGLIDAHGHIDAGTDNGVTPQKQAARYAALAFGVTTNFDPFSTELPNFESTETTQAGLTVGPRWIGTGSAIHGRPRNVFHLYSPIDTYADAEGVIRRKKALGALSVKSYKQPARRHRQMLVKAAREHGVNIVVEGETHFYNNISMILDGHTNLEHNLPVATVYDDVVQLMALAGVSNTPTLVVAFGELFGENYMYQRTEVWKDPRVRTYVQACLSGYSPLNTPYEAPPHARAMTTIHVADELYDIGVLAVSRSVDRLDRAGVRINAGSHGEIPGLAMHWEMALLAAGGMPAHRVLRTATINVAESLGVDHQIGSLEPGKLADLIVLRESPLDDIGNSTTVAMTMVNGRLHDAYSLDELAPRPRPRTRFYWETRDTHGIDWCEAWGGGCCT